MHRLRVLTYNCGLIRLRALGSGVRPGEPGRAEQIGRAIQALETDLVCLQEVFAEENVEQIHDVLRDSHPHAARHANGAALRLSHGLVILSRFPLSNSSFTEYGATLPGERVFVRRGVLAATLTLPSGRLLRVIDTHTTAGTITATPRSKATNRVRGAQLAEMTSLARRAALPTLAAGDLNTGPESSPENYLDLLADGWSDAFLDAAIRDSLHTATWDPKNALNPVPTLLRSPAQRIDHVLLDRYAEERFTVSRADILLTEPVVPEVSPRHPLSDHYGLLVELQERSLAPEPPPS